MGLNTNTDVLRRGAFDALTTALVHALISTPLRRLNSHVLIDLTTKAHAFDSSAGCLTRRCFDTHALRPDTMAAVQKERPSSHAPQHGAGSAQRCVAMRRLGAQVRASVVRAQHDRRLHARHTLRGVPPSAPPATLPSASHCQRCAELRSLHTPCILFVLTFVLLDARDS